MLSADSKVRSIEIEDALVLKPENKEMIENAMKVCFEKAQTKAQEVAMQKTKEIL
jgi:DNA-binding protein YbaB